MAYKQRSPVIVSEGGLGAVTVTGVLIGNGTSAVTANAVTQHDILVGGASNAITSVAPSATSGVPELIEIGLLVAAKDIPPTPDRATVPAAPEAIRAIAPAVDSVEFKAIEPPVAFTTKS